MPYDALLWAVIITALLFDFVNGWNDAANAIATVVGTRVLSPFKAIMLATVLNLAGAFMGEEVAKTIGGGLVHPDLISQTVLVGAMVSAIVWAAAMTFLGMPISGSHSLIGGLMGAAVAKAGVHVVQAKGIVQVLLAMLFSPILGFLLAFLLFSVIAYLFRNKRPGPTGRMFGWLQLVSVSSMSLTHGQNDAQKVMGVITLGLVLSGRHASMESGIPTWVVISCGAAIALGTACGGWKVIKTLGHGLSRLKPVDGFAAETAASLVLLGTGHLGVPVSTTHTITGSILGVGSTKGINSVRWGLGQKIILAWVFTLPSTMALGGGIYWLMWSGLGMDQQPTPPWKVAAAYMEGKGMALSWQESRDTTEYRIYRYEAIAEPQEKELKDKKKRYIVRVPETETVVADRLATPAFLDEGVTPGTRYVYMLVSINEHGPSMKSKEIVARAAPAPAKTPAPAATP
ncbi:MAG: inorganic phosphate transporter [Planctomycetota bacterium]|nr:inorganic phosphate transporter [Planctomycetota bacterium]